MSQEIYVNWKDLITAGARVSFYREIYNERHNITATWAHVEHPSQKYPPITFRATHNCDVGMTARIDDTPMALPMLVDLGINFRTQAQTR